jgi:hypothetical protein
MLQFDSRFDLFHAINPDGTLLLGEPVNDSASSPIQLSRFWAGEGPVASMHTRAIRTPSTRSQLFDVTYRDDVGVDAASLDRRDVRITGPNGFVAYAKLAAIRSSENGDGRVVARYKLAAPGGAWDAFDNGEYSVRLVGAQVRDADGHAAAGRVLGRFIVRVPLAAIPQAVRRATFDEVAEPLDELG